MTRLLSVLLSLTALASCTSVVDDPFLKTASVQGDWPSLATTVPAEYAVAALPGLSVISVRQTGGKKRIEQTILYANATDLAGENMLTVTMGQSAKVARSKGAPSQSQVEAEMRNVLSGVKMRISPVIADNAYGVFGYATGSIGKGGSCVYAWQFARNIKSYDGAGGIGSGDAAQIRMRYCSPTVSADRVVALMQGLRINPSLNNAGALAFAPVPLPLVEPFTEQQPTMTETPVAVRRTPKPAAVAETPVEAAVEKPVAQAAKVPLPGEAAALANTGKLPVIAGEDVAKVAAKPSFVPKPSDIASVTQ
jgi:hypothetical protein